MLAPYRVLDWSNEWGFLCGRLLADHGAEVIRIEIPGLSDEEFMGLRADDVIV